MLCEHDGWRVASRTFRPLVFNFRFGEVQNCVPAGFPRVKMEPKKTISPLANLGNVEPIPIPNRMIHQVIGTFQIFETNAS